MEHIWKIGSTAIGESVIRGFPVWSDEFLGDSLDISKWHIRSGGWNPEWHLPANVSVANSILTLTAKHEDYGGMHYTSGMIHTKNLESWKYGRFEVRMKPCYGISLVPAIWMMPASMIDENWGYHEGQDYGEIDIMEYFSEETNTHIRGALCYGPPLYGAITIYDTGVDLSADYHVYTLEWEPNEIRWYVDDVLFKTETSWYGISEYPHPFDDEFFFILMLNAGTTGEEPPGVYPAKMEIDWVRIFALYKEIKGRAVASDIARSGAASEENCRMDAIAKDE